MLLPAPWSGKWARKRPLRYDSTGPASAVSAAEIAETPVSIFSIGLTRGHSDEGTELRFPCRPVRDLPAGLRQRCGLGPLRAPLVQQRHPRVITAPCFGGNAGGIPDWGRRGKCPLCGEEDGQNSLPDEPLQYCAKGGRTVISTAAAPKRSVAGRRVRRGSVHDLLDAMLITMLRRPRATTRSHKTCLEDGRGSGASRDKGRRTLNCVRAVNSWPT